MSFCTMSGVVLSRIVLCGGAELLGARGVVLFCRHWCIYVSFSRCFSIVCVLARYVSQRIVQVGGVPM